MMPHASWPLCCNRDKPSQISGAASLLGSFNNKPRIPHTRRRVSDILRAGDCAYSWKESRLAQDSRVAQDIQKCITIYEKKISSISPN